MKRLTDSRKNGIVLLMTQYLFSRTGVRYSADKSKSPIKTGSAILNEREALALDGGNRAPPGWDAGKYAVAVWRIHLAVVI